MRHADVWMLAISVGAGTVSALFKVHEGNALDGRLNKDDDMSARLQMLCF